MSMQENQSGNLATAPRAAAIAGIISAVLMTAGLLFIRSSIPYTRAAAMGDLDATAKSTLILGLNLLPFAGIAFLWFIGVIRDYLGTREDRFLATVVLGSGLLFIALLFISAGIVEGGVLADTAADAIDDAIHQYAQKISYAIVYLFATRMAAVFMISTTTLTQRSSMMPRWLVITGYTFAAVLLLSMHTIEWVLLLFPLWVSLVSITIFVQKHARHSSQPDAGKDTRA